MTTDGKIKERPLYKILYQLDNNYVLLYTRVFFLLKKIFTTTFTRKNIHNNYA